MTDSEEEYFVRRDGYFFRPEAAGYTSSASDAGHYSRSEAERYRSDEGVTIHLVSEYKGSKSELRVEIGRLNTLINNPHSDDFLEAVRLEAAHQRERYPEGHDANKTPLDWFWLVGYLAQKAATAALDGDMDKARHHTISTSAAMLNWHRQMSQGEGSA